MQEADKGRRAIAIIPARGGSKGLPRKNLRPFLGRPLVVRAIETARDAEHVGRVVVTTEDPEIEAVAREAGAEIVRRPPELATDDARSIPAVEHALTSLGLTSKGDETFVLVQATSPLCRPRHLDDGLDLFWSGDAGTVVSVAASEYSPFKELMRDSAGHLVPLFDWERLSAPRQNLPATFRQSGAFWITRVATFLETGRLFTPPVLPYEMGARESTDIDSAADLARAERYAREEIS